MSARKGALENLFCLRCNREIEVGHKSVAVYMFAQTVGIRPRQKSSSQRICFCPPCSVSLAMGPPRSPLESARSICRPNVGYSQRIGDTRYRFSLLKTFQSPNPILRSRLFHRWLLLGNAIDAEPKLALSRMRWQQTVHDVVAHLRVHDVAAPVS